MLRANWLVFAILLCPVLQAQDENAPVTHVSSTSPTNGRFEIVQSTLAARWTFKLDKQTGSIWQIVVNKDGDNVWRPMVIVGIPKSQYSSGQHFQIFMSGLAAKFTFLINTDSGRTWQLQKSTDPLTNEDFYTWEPI